MTIPKCCNCGPAYKCPMRPVKMHTGKLWWQCPHCLAATKINEADLIAITLTQEIK